MLLTKPQVVAKLVYSMILGGIWFRIQWFLGSSVGMRFITNISFRRCLYRVCRSALLPPLLLTIFRVASGYRGILAEVCSRRLRLATILFTDEIIVVLIASRSTIILVDLLLVVLTWRKLFSSKAHIKGAVFRRLQGFTDILLRDGE